MAGQNDISFLKLFPNIEESTINLSSNWEYEQYALHCQLLTESHCQNTYESELGLPKSKIESLVPDPFWVNKFSFEWLKTHRILPLHHYKNTLYVASASPFNPALSEMGLPTKVVLVPETDLTGYFCKQLTPSEIWQSSLGPILFEALSKQASDIHFFQDKQTVSIQYRIHGDLTPAASIPASQYTQIKSLIKLFGKMDLAKSTHPQDGRFQVEWDGLGVDIRCATLPTHHAEDIVLRILNPKIAIKPLSALGFSEAMLAQLKWALSQKSGLLLVTGATGSGKSTSLYACLKEYQRHYKRNIVTLEDPVEYHIEGVRQSQINLNIGYTFAKGLKAILRQDPDLIMIGEIRDKETAQTALEAAHTGHLVLATLHTQNSQSTLQRLSGFQLDPFLIEKSLKLILSQSLIQAECPDCETGCPNCKFTQKLGRKLSAELITFPNGMRYTSLLENWDDEYKKHPYYTV